MRSFLIASMFFLLLNTTFGQSQSFTTEIFELINQSRTNPKQFLADYETDIQKYQPKYINILKNAQPIPPAIWDKGLEAMAKSAIDDGNLNPIYKGENKLCGFSSGQSSGTFTRSAIQHICSIYTNINNRSYKYIGLHFNPSKNNGYCFYWGKSCEREKITFTYNEKVDSSKVDFGSLNTASKVSYMNTAEQRMVLEINFVRKYPKVYAQIISAYLSDRSESIWGLQYDTYQAGMELIEELNSMQPLNVLNPKECVFNAAKIHGLDCQRRGFFDHTGSDQSAPWDRILKQCSDFKTGNENGSGGSLDPRKSVIGLLLDSGISTRGHRYNILDKRWKYVGCYRYKDAKYGYFWVQNFGY